MSGKKPCGWIATASALAVFVAVVGLSCDNDKPAPVAPPGAPNVLLILIDTLRADKLGCYGSDLGLTPNIDEFAASGVRFDQAFSHAPWTLPSVASLLTSTQPETHGAGHKRGKKFTFARLNGTVRTLQECLKDQGYETAAFVNVFFLSPKFGINRGFDKYDFVPPVNNQRERRAKEVTDLAVEWIRGKKDESKPFFLMAHYFDPHLSYDPPEKFRRKYAATEDRRPGPMLWGTEPQMIAFRQGRIALNSIPVKRLEKLYHGEIASTDREVGRLLDEIRDMGLDKSTIVVLTADHGEEFLDHDGFEHGHTLYDELIHVPLVVRYSDVIEPGTVNATVGHIDVAPTICELAGVQKEDTFDGRSLIHLMTGKTKKDRPILSQGNMWGPIRTSWRHGGYKLINAPGGVELYDVSVDRREQRDLGALPSLAIRREKMLKDMAVVLKIARASSSGESSGVNLSPEENARLRALGYLADEEDSEDDAPDSATSQPTTQATTRPVSNDADESRTESGR